MRSAFAGFILCAMLALACAGGDDPAPTPVATTPAETPTAPPQASPTPEPTPPPATPTPASEPGPVVREGDIGPGLLWEPVLGLPRLQEVCPDTFDPVCIAEAEREDGAPEAVIAFFLEHEMFLFSFEEMGVVDYGAVNSPFFNMGRPTPVLLNGDFGLLYVAELVPPNWKDEPGYDDPAIEDFLWYEYTTLSGMTASDTGQTFHLSVPIGGCRACERNGYLNLAAIFNPQGSLTGVDVLPITDE